VPVFRALTIKLTTVSLILPLENFCFLRFSYAWHKVTDERGEKLDGENIAIRAYVYPSVPFDYG
jgi:hypothetical protein